MIEFDGTDLIIDKPVDKPHLRRALAASLGVPEERIALIDDVARYPDPSAADIVCVESSVLGEFAKLASIQARAIRLPHDTQLGLLQQLCELLDTRCLVPDEGPNPYCMWLLVPGETPKSVCMDPVALDEGRYVLSR